MPMLRSGTSTLSMMERRTTKYQKFLNLSNVFLLTTATILIFSAVVLIEFYYVDKLDFWSTYFTLVPYLMIVLGAFTFLVCLYGFLISGSENRALLAVYALMLGVAFLLQLVSIFSSVELRTIIYQENVGSVSVHQDLNKYGVDASVTAKWDSMQRNLHCCGGNGYTDAFLNYQSTEIGRNNSVPNSCCHEEESRCGEGLLAKTGLNTYIREQIYVVGCLTMLKDNLKNGVIPMMTVYAVIGVLLALVELITIVLACAYVAQISRKLNREDKMWRHANAGGGQPSEADVTDALTRGETMC